MSGVRAEVDAILSSLSSLGGSVIANAAKQAELQALQAGKSVREAANIAREMQRESQFDARAQGANWLERMVIDFERGVARYGDALDQQLDHEREVARLRDRMSGTTGTGGGGGASSTAAIDRIIEREIERLAILRETDPVQKELLRNSRYLADATDGERAALEALIATRIAEEEQLDILQQKRDFFADTTYDALSGLILQGNSLRDVMANVAMAIADAALQAALLGKGPFAGGGGGGGLLGFVGDLLFPKLAGGGLIYGPGDGRSDDVPILASSGEFMMNAVATKRYRHVLEAMNSGGALPGFAQGGMIGGSASPRPSMPGAGVQAIEMNVNVSGANGNREIEQMVYQGVERALTQYDREILPIRIRQIESNGRRVG